MRAAALLLPNPERWRVGRSTIQPWIAAIAIRRFTTMFSRSPTQNSARALTAFSNDDQIVTVEQESRMPSLTEWKVPPGVQPRAEDYSFDLERALASVVGLHSIIPNDAFTADTLGVERAGNGVLIDDGLVLTIGYLITEAEAVWLHLGDGRVVEGHALGFDQETGFGLVQALGRLDLDPLPLGTSTAAQIDDRVVVGGIGGRTRSLAGRIAAKQEFAGYWEYALEEAIFTYPAHPNWGGAGLISAAGELIGIGSLQIERAREGKNEHLNMVVPIDLLKPVLDDLRRFGRINKPARPWLGVFSTEIDDRVVVAGIAPKGPAARAELKPGDLILAVRGEKIVSQMQFYKKLWSLGPAGVDVPLTLYREGDTFDVSVRSSDRAKFLKAPRLH
jgi:S1-C subfamily serine protease